MTPTLSDITSLTRVFSERYNVSAIDFLWTSENGFDTFTVYSTTPQAGVLTTKVPSFDYNSETDDLAIRELLMTIIDDTEWTIDGTDIHLDTITEIGGSLLISPTDAPVFEGLVTSVSNTLIQY